MAKSVKEWGHRDCWCGIFYKPYAFSDTDADNTIKALTVFSPLPPLSDIWDVMLVWRKGNIKKTVSCSMCVQRYEQFLQTVSGFDLACLALLSSELLCVFGLHGAIYRLKIFCLHSSFYLLVSWAWWDWPLTWLTNHHPSVLWHCWLGHVTCKIVSKMTCNIEC